MSPLARESRVFATYLAGYQVDDRILETYRAAVTSGAAGTWPEPIKFDRLLARVARAHPTLSRAVDVYARFFRSAAPVRKRLILMLAILESHARPYAAMDRVDRGGRPFVLLRTASAALGSLILLVVATVALTPLRLVLAGRPAGGD